MKYREKKENRTGAFQPKKTNIFFLEFPISKLDKRKQHRNLYKIERKHNDKKVSEPEKVRNKERLGLGIK